MAYDDDSKFDFEKFESIAVVLERYLNAPENITVTKLLALTQAAHDLTAGQEREPGLSSLATGLRERGLSAVPFDTVARVMDAVGALDRSQDVLASVSLRDVERIVAR